MREIIKFRAWIPSEQRMAKVGHIRFDEGTKSSPELVGVELRDGGGNDNYSGKIDGGRINAFYLMRFTGLKDKNGVEIYESDLVAFTEAGKRKVGEVIWRNSDAMFVVQDKDGWGSFALHTEDGLEVTGNKYEKS